MVYLEEEVNFFHREDYYFTRLSVQLQNALRKENTAAITDIGQALIKFKRRDDVRKRAGVVIEEPDDTITVEIEEDETTQKNRQLAAAMAKARWFPVVGLNPDGSQPKVVRRRPPANQPNKAALLKELERQKNVPGTRKPGGKAPG